MVKKTSLNKIFKRSIKNTRSRFISIFAIVLLGASFFAGLRNTPATMRTSMDDYFVSHHFADLRLISTLGFTQDDLEYIQSLDETKQVSGSFRTDLVMENEKGDEYNVIAHSINDYFDQYEIVYGRDTKNDDEILVDKRIGDEEMLGQKYTIKNDYGSKEVTVVGIVDSPLYIVPYLKGTNSYSNQSNDGFILMNNNEIQDMIFPEAIYDLEDTDFLYNEILISYNLKDIPSIFSSSYDDYTKKTKVSIEDDVTIRLKERRKDIVSRIEEQLEEPTKEYEEGLKKYEEGKNAYDLQIANGKLQLIDAKLTLLDYASSAMDQAGSLDNYESTIESKIATTRTKINLIKSKINSLTNQAEKYEVVDDATYQELVDRFGEDIPTQDEITAYLNEHDITLEAMIEALNSLDPEATYDDFVASLEDLHGVKTQIEELEDELNTLLNDLDKELGNIGDISSTAFSAADGLVELEKANLEIEKNQALLDQTELTVGKQLEKAKAQLDDAKAQLDEARASLDSIPSVTLYSLTHNENYGTVSYDNDSGAIESIAYVVPYVFFAVAALVTLTTMTRMIEEQRGQSGILRALGYTKVDVLMYYIKYAALATIPAALIGLLFGTFSLAEIIYYLYTTLMYSVTNASTHFVFVPSVTLLTIFISVGLTILITIYVCMKELNLNAATLMRPKAPKAGKRVLLERINFLWTRFTFNQKVTVRNLFRNKKRALMSIIGIAGCSALLVMGLGIKVSINGILDKQFDKLWSYDAIVNFVEDQEYDEAKEIEDDVATNSNVSSTLLAYVTGGYSNSTTKASDTSTNIVILANRNNSLIHFYSFDEQDQEITLDDDGVFIYEKTAEDLGLSKGDSYTLTIGDIIYTVRISEVIEGYTQNYVYMSSSYYEELTGKEIKYNTVYAGMKDNDAKLNDQLDDSLCKNEEILNVEFVNELHSQFTKMLSSMNYIIIIITGAAAMLAFVVLYNLTNINIQERISEIATLKVLGFYPKETYDYIFKENLILGIIGTFIGLPLGTLLHRFIILLVETEAVMFVRQLNIYPYIFAIVLSLFFIEFINIIMRKVVDQVKMVESLKSIE